MLWIQGRCAARLPIPCKDARSIKRILVELSYKRSPETCKCSMFCKRIEKESLRASCEVEYNLPHWNQEIALGYFCSVIRLVPQFRVLTTEAISHTREAPKPVSVACFVRGSRKNRSVQVVKLIWIHESTKYNLPHWNQEIALGYFCSVIRLVPQFRVLTMWLTFFARRRAWSFLRIRISTVHP
jgi:hypothetical protein